MPLCYFLLIVVLTVFCGGLNKAQAALKVDITRGNAEKTAIGLAAFAKGSRIENEASAKIAKLIRSDLSNTGLFKVAEMGGGLEVDINAFPVADSWKNTKAEIMLTVALKEISDNKMEIRFRVWDVPSSRQLSGKSLIFEISNWRRAAHIISDVIYSRVTGDTGYFDTKIVYIAEDRTFSSSRRVAIMDQDGANTRYLTDESRFVFSPRFSPDARSIVYMSYIDRKARIVIRDLQTSKEAIIGNFEGVASAPRFSPDGKSILVSESINGLTNVYNINLRSRKFSNLTKNSSINTSASYSPNRRAIVFNSDRSGSQQLYAMDANGKNQHRISFGSGRYATPVWSPRGDWIAFTKIKSGKFYIGVMKPDGSGERLLTEGYMVESPTWSPNGRVIMFTRQDMSTQPETPDRVRIFSVDITGVNERLIPTSTDASSAHWSNPSSQS